MSKDSEIIHRKLDGELSKAETGAFKKMIRRDPRAMLEYEMLKKVTETSERLVKPLIPPADFTSRVMKRLKP